VGTAASYDCRAPQTAAQRTICRTPQLDRLDEQYIVRYNNLRLQMEQAGTYTNAIRDVDANRAELWDKINACPPQDVDCMATAYRFQLAGLHACFPQDPKPDSPECAQTKGTLRFAKASQCTYQTDATRNNPQACGPDWEVVKPAELHMKNIDFHDEESGFDAILLRGRKNGEHLLAFRGTNETERNDWLNNLQQAAGHVAKQYKQARDLARKLQNALPPGSVIRTTGHSLGGGLATYRGAATGSQLRRGPCAGDTLCDGEESADLRPGPPGGLGRGLDQRFGPSGKNDESGSSSDCGPSGVGGQRRRTARQGPLGAPGTRQAGASAFSRRVASESPLLP
jgi:hypothetical protein